MKEPSSASRSPLGYLAAFTLGIICMGAIMFFTGRATIKPSGDIPGSGESTQVSPAQKVHFQREAKAPVPDPRANLPRGTIRHPVAAAPSEVEMTESVAEEIEPMIPVDTEPATYIVNQRTTVIANDRADFAPTDNENTRVSGRVVLVGPRPQERVLPLDPQCARKHPPGPVTTRFYVTGKDNGLADTLVVITAGLPQQQWPVPKEPVTLRIRGCIYENHVAAVQVNQPLLVLNRDTTLHNVLVVSQRNREQNRAILPGQRPHEFEFPEAERFLRFKCDVHPWEFAYVNVIDHPFFAITDKNGNFTLRDLPPGKYNIQAHHRKAGIVEREITVEKNRGVSLRFELKAPAPQALDI